MLILQSETTLLKPLAIFVAISSSHSVTYASSFTNFKQDSIKHILWLGYRTFEKLKADNFERF